MQALTKLYLWLLSLIAICFFLIGVYGCVPLALYNYATHDVKGEAEQSDCERMPERCKVKP